MTKEIKNAKLTLSGGILLILVGIFLLYLQVRTNMLDSPLLCLRKSDFYSIDGRNISVLILFCIIFAGFLMELLGFFKLAKAVNDIKIFYNRLNLYFIATLFILISIKDWMAENDHLFFVISCVSERMYDGPGGIFAYAIVGSTILFLLILLIYFLLKDYIYLSRVFKSKLPIITLAVCIVSILLFFSKEIFSSFLPYEYRNFLKSLMSIKVFIPYLVICFITYLFMRASVDEVKDFSIYDFIFSKRRIFLTLIVAVLITAIALWMFAPKLAKSLSFYVLFIPLLFVPLLLFFRIMAHFELSPITVAVTMSCISVVYVVPILLPYLFIIPVSLALCVVLKLQQRNFTKSSIALMAASCAAFGYFAMFS